MASTASIPRIFHRVWLGGDPMPEAHIRFGQSWLDHNPGWEMRTWTSDNLPRLRNQLQFDGSQHRAQQSALVRYEMVEEHGGVYIDTDFLCLRNIEPLLTGATFVAGWANSEYVNNALIGATPGHAILREIIDVIPYRIATRPGQLSTVQSGVDLVTETVTTYAAADPTVVIHEPNLQTPYDWREKERHDEVFPEAYAVHHWALSWHRTLNSN